MQQDRKFKIFLILAVFAIALSVILQPTADALMSLCGAGTASTATPTPTPTPTPLPAFVAATSCVSADTTMNCAYPTGSQAGDVIIGAIGNSTGPQISNAGANLLQLTTTGQFISL